MSGIKGDGITLVQPHGSAEVTGDEPQRPAIRIEDLGLPHLSWSLLASKYGYTDRCRSAETPLLKHMIINRHMGKDTRRERRLMARVTLQCPSWVLIVLFIIVWLWK